MRLGKRDLGVLPYLVHYEEGTTEGTEFGIATQQDDANRIKEMLSPIEEKVSWE